MSIALSRRATRLCTAALIASLTGCDGAPVATPGTADDGPRADAPYLRYRVDVARHRVWILTARGVGVYDQRTKQYDVVDLPAWQWVDASHTCPPDLAIGPAGEAIVTSNVVPTLWRVDPRTRAVSLHPLALDADHDKDVGFSGLAYSRAHGAFWAASAVHGSVWRIDPDLRRARKVRVSDELRGVCDVDPQRLGSERSGAPAAAR